MCEDLIRRAEDYRFESDFIDSVLDYYEENGEITEKQEEALERAIEYQENKF